MSTQVLPVSEQSGFLRVALKVRLRGDWGETLFTVELADTPQERSRGLMFRENMPRGAGMLFVYDAPQQARFWMKNTLI